MMNKKLYAGRGGLVIVAGAIMVVTKGQAMLLAELELAEVVSSLSVLDRA